MRLSADIIVESLSEWVIDSAFTERGGFEFSGVRIFTGEETELERDMIYVCAPKLLYSSDRSKFDGCCFVIKVCPFDYQPSNAIILNEQVDLTAAVNKLVSLFEKINRFERNLREAAIAHGGFKPFFTLAETMLPECLLVMTNSSYSLICKTMDTVNGNEYINSILKRGFYSKTDLDLMAGRGYFEDERKYRMPILYDAAHTISKLPFLVRSYRYKGATVSFIGCYFLKAGPQNIQIALFRLFTDAIGDYMKANGIFDQNLPSRQQIIDDLIKCTYSEPSFYCDRCTMLGIPSRGEFRIGLVQTGVESIIKAAQMTNQLKTYCAVQNYGIFQYAASVIILFTDWHSYDVKDKSVFEDSWQALISTLKANKAHMGVSLRFKTMDRFSVAYKQALCSAKIGKRQEPEAGVYFYSKYYIYDMLETYGGSMSLDSVYTSYFDDLEDGKNTAYTNLDLLYVYLASERNIALTSRRVHMHRNGVLYRIQKIEDMLCLDLNSADVRLRLLVSFKIMELQGRIKLLELDGGEEPPLVSSIE